MTDVDDRLDQPGGDPERPDVADAPPRPDVADDAERPEAAGDTARLGAYALGALTPEERADVEDRLAASPALRDELRRLIPVAALLREGTDPPPSPAADPTSSQGHAPGTMVAPSGAAAPSVPDRPAERSLSRSRPEPELVVDPRDDPDSSPPVDLIPGREDDSPLLEMAPDRPVDGADPSPLRLEASPGSLSSRPVRRPARPVREPSPARTGPSRASTLVAGWPASWLTAGLATLVAVGAILWALAMVDRLDARREEVASLEAEARALRARGDAAVVALAPGEGGPAGADGVVVVAPSEGSLIVRVGGLPASAEGRVYQVWFQDEVDGRWIVGPVFRVGEGGAALVELPAAAPPFTRLAVSDEPSPGSEAPTGAFLLEGSVADGESGTPSP